MARKPKSNRNTDGLNGPWTEIAEGACKFCGCTRRLYQPTSRDDIGVCSPCSQVYVYSVLDQKDRLNEVDQTEL